MASIKEITKSDGSVSYKVTVSRRQNGKLVRYYKTFVPTEKAKTKIKHELDLFVAECESKCDSGLIVSEMTTFREYVPFWVRDYAEKKMGKRTLEDALR